MNKSGFLLLKTLDFVTSNGPLTKASLKPALDLDTLLISDANPTFTAFCHDEGCSHDIVNLSKGQPVNERLKR